MNNSPQPINRVPQRLEPKSKNTSSGCCWVISIMRILWVRYFYSMKKEYSIIFGLLRSIWKCLLRSHHQVRRFKLYRYIRFYLFLLFGVLKDGLMRKLPRFGARMFFVRILGCFVGVCGSELCWKMLVARLMFLPLDVYHCRWEGNEQLEVEFGFLEWYL